MMRKPGVEDQTVKVSLGCPANSRLFCSTWKPAYQTPKPQSLQKLMEAAFYKLNNKTIIVHFRRYIYVKFGVGTKSGKWNVCHERRKINYLWWGRGLGRSGSK